MALDNLIKSYQNPVYFTKHLPSFKTIGFVTYIQIISVIFAFCFKYENRGDVNLGNK